MAHFVEINDLKKVIQAVALDNKDTQDTDGNEVETVGQKYLNDAFGGNWLKTSYNTRSGVHKLGGTPFRKNYAGIGYKYDEDKDAFIPPQPYNSWTLNEDTCQYDAPVACPNDEKKYIWNEETISWVLGPQS